MHKTLCFVLVFLGCNGEKPYELPISPPPVAESAVTDASVSVDGQPLRQSGEMALMTSTEYPISGEFRALAQAAEVPNTMLHLLVNAQGKEVHIADAFLNESKGENGLVLFEGAFTTPSKEGQVELRITTPHPEKDELVTIFSAVINLEEAEDEPASGSSAD